MSIIIVGYNSRRFLDECLQSVYSQVFKDIEVIFIDNCSNDGTREFIKNKYPNLKVIYNDFNAGFSKANNQGVRLSEAKYILTLNCDTKLDKNFISNSIKALESYEKEGYKIGMLSGKILRMDGKTIDSTGLVLTRFRRFYDRGSGDLDNGKYNTTGRVFGPCAAAALYKREMLEDIKTNGEYFDEDFFAFVEDVDLAWRAHKKGWIALYVPDAICYHSRNSKKYPKPFMQYHACKNRFFMMLKNEKFGIHNVFVIFLYDVPRFLYVFFSNGRFVKDLPHMVKLAKTMLVKRRIIRL